MHLEVLNENTRKVWDQFGFLKGFYLAGGTALALQIGHRVSVDLDFFSDEPIKKTLLKELEEKFGYIKIFIKSTNELTVEILGVKVTFLHYPFPLLDGKVKTSVVPLASVKDLSSMKAYALGRRATLKDYIDLHIIVSKGLATIQSIIIDAKNKYGDAFNDRLFFEQLVYTEDIGEEPIVWLVPSISKEEVKSFFEGEIKKIVL